jgi:hypothetical protein
MRAFVSNGVSNERVSEDATREVDPWRILGSTGKKAPVAQFRTTKTAGVYARHENGCRAVFGEGRCRSEPSYVCVARLRRSAMAGIFRVRPVAG